MESGEAGQSLPEVVVAVGICAVFVAAVLGACVTAIHRFGPDPVQSALEARIASEMRVAVDVLKYQGSSIEPTSIATTIPLASASPVSAQVSITTAALDGGGISISISGSTQTPPRTASETTTLAQRAPAPGSQITAPGTIPAPTGAP